MVTIRHLSAMLAGAATFGLALPAAALDSVPASAAKSDAAVSAFVPDIAYNHRWDRYRGRDRIGVGDVLAGVLILGTVAAIAKANRDRGDYRRDYPPYRGDEYRYRTDEYERDGRGIDRAVDMCVDEVERGNDRVAAVDAANRTGEGWSVSGSLEGGASFACRIDNVGRIRGIEIGGDDGARTDAEDRQYDDDFYARARLKQGHQPGVAAADEADTRPQWNPEPPPLPSSGDGRYELSNAPDFEQGG